MLATTVGNYPRVILDPGGASVRRALTQYEEGRISWERVLEEQDRFTLEVIQEQVEAGLDVLTDGQVRWDDSQTYFARGLQGFELDGLLRYFDTNTYFRQPVVNGRIVWKEPVSLRDYRFLAEHSPKPVKLVITGPYTLARLAHDGSYEGFRLCLLDLARALNQEARALQSLEPHLIQFDEPALLRSKEDFPLFREAVDLLVEGLTVKTALYTYFGDVEGLAPDLFNLPFPVFGLDFVMGPRNWQLLRSFPADRELGLGVMDARNTKLETVEELVDAVRRAAEFVSPERLYVNPSCGLEFLPRDRARAKLFRLGEGVQQAREVMAR